MGIGSSASPLLLATDDVQHLLWIPGVGRINAFTIHLEIDDIERFPHVKNFLSCTKSKKPEWPRRRSPDA